MEEITEALDEVLEYTTKEKFLIMAAGALAGFAAKELAEKGVKYLIKARRLADVN